MVWDKITYSFINFNGRTVDVLEGTSDSTPHLIMDEITYLSRDLS